MQLNGHAVNPHIYKGECQWVALLCVPGQERRACIFMRRHQWKPWWPRYRGMVKLARRRQRIDWRSVAPGYLFLPLIQERDRNWQFLEQVPTIHGRLNNSDGSPRFITIQEISELARIEDALQSDTQAAKLGIPFKRGQMVRVRDSLLGWQGPIVKIDDRRRITVEVNMLGRATRVELPATELEAI